MNNRNLAAALKSTVTLTELYDIYKDVSKDDMKGEQFTLINFEYAVVEKGKYYACEIGVVKFSISNGIIDAYTTFISPLPLPSGSWAEAKAHSAVTHQITASSTFGYWNDKYEEILTKLQSMMPASKNLLFVVGSMNKASSVEGDLETTFAESKGCLAYLLEKANCTRPTIRIGAADLLIKFLAVKCEICDEKSKVMTNYLARETHNFDNGIRCWFHAEIDNLRCAYAAVFRFYFNTIDFIYETRSICPDVRLLRVNNQFISKKPTVAGVSGAFDIGQACASEKKMEKPNTTDFDRLFDENQNWSNRGNMKPVSRLSHEEDRIVILSGRSALADGVIPIKGKNENEAGPSQDKITQAVMAMDTAPERHVYDFEYDDNGNNGPIQQTTQTNNNNNTVMAMGPSEWIRDRVNEEVSVVKKKAQTRYTKMFNDRYIVDRDGDEEDLSDLDQEMFLIDKRMVNEKQGMQQQQLAEEMKPDIRPPTKPDLPAGWMNDWDDQCSEEFSQTAVLGSKTPSLANSLESPGFMNVLDENNSGMQMDNHTASGGGNLKIDEMVARICVKPPDPSELPMPPMEWITCRSSQGRPNGVDGQNRNTNYGGNKRFFDD